MKKTCILCPAYFEGRRAENICPKCLKKEYDKARGKTNLDKPAENDKEKV